MNDTQMKEHLDWALDAIDDGDMATAIDHINQVKDHLEQKEDEANEAIKENFYADARDHHLINQDFHRALGEKK